MENKPVVQTPTTTKVTPKYVSAPVHKQEPAETPAPPEPTPLEACVTEKMGQGMSEEEATNACKAELEGEKKPPPTEEKTLGTPKPPEQALGDKLIAVMKEYTDASIAKAKMNTEKRLAEVQEETEKELIESIRKGLGLQKDPVVHLSEVEGMVRKILLDKEPHGKRTITETGEKPTEGTELTKSKAIVKPASDIYKSLMENKGSI